MNWHTEFVNGFTNRDVWNFSILPSITIYRFPYFYLTNMSWLFFSLNIVCNLV